MKQIKTISIRTKLLTILVATTLIVLLVYAFISFGSFTKDKIAYVFDSNLAHAKTTAQLMKSETQNQVEKIQQILRGYDVAKAQFTAFSYSIFEKSNDLESVQVFTIDPATSKPKLLSSLSKNQRPIAAFSFEKTTQMIEKTISQGIAVIELDSQISVWGLSIRTFDPVTRQLVITIAFFNSANFLDVIAKSDIQNIYLFDNKKQIIFKSKVPPHQVDENNLVEKLKELDFNLQNFGVKEIDLDKNNKALISFSQVGIAGLWVVEMTPRKMALKALGDLKKITIQLLILLIALTVFGSVLFASGLTTNLGRLHDAMKKVSAGDLSVKAVVSSRDEIGDLAVGFNDMTDEIVRLIEQTKESARMEGELKTAKLVQSTLFPKAESIYEKSEISGFYMPASECSGDWWSYQKIDNKIYVAIGDATGHGVPAALVTAAARSAFQLISSDHNQTISQKLKTLNSAIYQTMQGQIQMTFFLGCLDQETGEFTYSNASHDPPFYFPFEGAESHLSKQEIANLTEATGARLGQTDESQYEECKIQLKPGQVIVFYTDGVADVVSEEGKKFGERKFIKSILDSLNQERKISISNQTLQSQISEFRKQTPLDDDVTYFFMAYHG